MRFTLYQVLTKFLPETYIDGCRRIPSVVTINVLYLERAAPFYMIRAKFIIGMTVRGRFAFGRPPTMSVIFKFHKASATSFMSKLPSPVQIVTRIVIETGLCHQPAILTASTL